MAKPRNKFLDYLVYVAFRLLETFVRMSDIRANYDTFRLMGDLAYRLDRRHRHRALEHLRRSFPDWTLRQRRQVARQAMRSFFYLGLEMLFTTRLMTPTRWRACIRLTNMAESMRLMIQRRQPIVMVTGHFGNWEIAAYTMSVLGFPVYAVARALDNPYLNDYLTGLRQRSGLTILDKKGATMQMDEILSGKNILAWVADQDAGKKGLFVDFFGRKASAFKSVALLAMQYQAPVVVGYGRRLDLRCHFEIAVQRIIQPEEWADKDDPLRWITQEYTRELELAARMWPEQYLWPHRRWKHRPKGEPQPADGIA